MSIYQQIKEKFIMKNAREDWAPYRTELTEMILDRDPESVMIIGAGHCNDIDLCRIAAAAGRVILLDIDKEATAGAVNMLPEDLRDKVTCKEASLTGISEDDMEGFCDRLMEHAREAGKCHQTEIFREALLTEIDTLEEKLICKEKDLNDLIPKEAAEVVVCCGVCSQLFSSLSFYIRSLLYSLEDILPGVALLEEAFHERIRRMNERIIPAINRAIYKAAGKTAIFGNENMPEAPVEGAYQCIMDVRGAFSPEERHLVWSFNKAQGITYDMLIQICDKNKL